MPKLTCEPLPESINFVPFTRLGQNNSVERTQRYLEDFEISQLFYFFTLDKGLCVNLPESGKVEDVIFS